MTSTASDAAATAEHEGRYVLLLLAGVPRRVRREPGVVCPMTSDGSPRRTVARAGRDDGPDRVRATRRARHRRADTRWRSRARRAGRARRCARLDGQGIDDGRGGRGAEPPASSGSATWRGPDAGTRRPDHVRGARRASSASRSRCSSAVRRLRAAARRPATSWCARRISRSIELSRCCSTAGVTRASCCAWPASGATAPGGSRSTRPTTCTHDRGAVPPAGDARQRGVRGGDRRGGPAGRALRRGHARWLFRRHAEAFRRSTSSSTSRSPSSTPACDAAGAGRRRDRLRRPHRLHEVDRGGGRRGGGAGLPELAEFVQRDRVAHRGEVVKMLGDGVRFHFDDPQRRGAARRWRSSDAVGPRACHPRTSG